MRLMSLTLMLAAGAALALPASEVSAAQRHSGAKPAPASASARYYRSGVRFAARPQSGGAPLVSDGPGTPYGFHRLPGQYRVGARLQRYRQAAALRQAVETDALTSGGFRSGRLGSDVAASTPYSNYGVFSGADGYGSPFFAGYYGPGGGEDLGPLGTTYD